MRTPYGETFSVEARGQRWTGTWERQGKEVCVTSAFGSRREPVGRRRPDLVAQEALAKIIDEWARART